MSDFTALGGRNVFDGNTFSVHVERFRHADGDVVEREIVRRQDAVGMVAYEDGHVFLVAQPREAIGRDLLEIPAGKLDVADETPMECAGRELAEEIGKAASSWEEITSYYASSGYTDEAVHLFAATGLRDVPRPEGDDERIEVVAWPLDDLEGAIASCEDAKTLVGLLWLARRLG
jgi:ADP-ribose pyrophosphatase